jgi:hypothetical protein
MPDIVSLGGAILPTYPTWVRALMFGSALTWTIAYSVLLFMAPKAVPPSVAIGTFVQAQSTKLPDSLVFELTLINNTGKTVAASQLDILYYKDAVSTDGLQSSQRVPSIYVVAQTEAGLVASDGSDFVKKVQIDMNAPFAGQPQMEVSIPINHIIEDKQGDQLFVMLTDAQPVDRSINNAQITVSFSDGSKQVAHTEIQLPTGP